MVSSTFRVPSDVRLDTPAQARLYQGVRLRYSSLYATRAGITPKACGRLSTGQVRLTAI